MHLVSTTTMNITCSRILEAEYWTSKAKPKLKSIVLPPLFRLKLGLGNLIMSKLNFGRDSDGQVNDVLLVPGSVGGLTVGRLNVGREPTIVGISRLKNSVIFDRVGFWPITPSRSGNLNVGKARSRLGTTFRET